MEYNMLLGNIINKKGGAFSKARNNIKPLISNKI